MFSRLACISLALLLPPLAFAKGSHSPSVSECEGAQADASHVAVQFDGKANDLLNELVAFRHLEVEHNELVGSVATRFDISCMSVGFLMQALADIAGVQVIREGDTRFRLARVKNLAEITQLRREADVARGTDRQKLIELLQRLVVLPQQGGADEPPISVEGEYHELGNMAMEDKDYVAAERWFRARLEDLDRHGARVDTNYGIALSNVADALAYQDNYATATPVYERALAILEKQTDLAAPPNAVLILETLSNAALAAERFEEAEVLAERAWRLLRDPQRSQWQPAGHALEIAAEAEIEIAHLGSKERSGMHLDRALELLEARDPADVGKLPLIRNQVMITAARSGDFARAAEIGERQMAAADRRGEKMSESYLFSLYMLLAVYAEQENLDRVLALWPRLIEVRRAFLGENSPSVVVALRQLATLYRLNGMWTEAEGPEQSAAAITPVDDSPDLVKRDLASIFALQSDPVLPVYCGRFEWNPTDLGYALIPPVKPPHPAGLYFELSSTPRPMPADPLGQARYFEQIAECADDSPTYAGAAMEKALRLRIALVGAHSPDSRRAAKRSIEFYRRAGSVTGVERVRALSGG